MLISYEIHASDLGAAINIATKRAMNDGYSHVSVNSTKQTGPTSWTIVVFCSNSQGVTRR